MIRLRKPSGEEFLPEEEWGFVEMCDTQGKVAFVMFKDGPGYRLFSKKDKEALGYAKVFGVEFVDQRAISLD